jgi:hypothetical protein
MSPISGPDTVRFFLAFFGSSIAIGAHDAICKAGADILQVDDLPEILGRILTKIFRVVDTGRQFFKLE